MIMKILLVLLLLLGGCTIRRTPLDQQEVEKVVLRVRGAFDITEEEIDRLWENGTLNEAKVESFRSLHERTTYK